jgi:hypothetical protein
MSQLPCHDLTTHAEYLGVALHQHQEAICALLTYYFMQYAEMEMRHRFINHARNVWDRAVSLLPRIDQLWYKVLEGAAYAGAVNLE